MRMSQRTTFGPVFDESAGKRPTNLSINIDLLEKSRAAGVNLSATLEAALKERLLQERREAWISASLPAIDAYNQRVSTSGSFGDRMRRF